MTMGSTAAKAVSDLIPLFQKRLPVLGFDTGLKTAYLPVLCPALMPLHQGVPQKAGGLFQPAAPQELKVLFRGLRGPLRLLLRPDTDGDLQARSI